MCGKLSKNRIGEYVRKNGKCGYINQEEGDTGPVCTDCRERPAAGRKLVR
jgi:hypothetical protein